MREEIPGDFERNLAAIRRFRAAGNKFVVSTGRGLASIGRDFPKYADFSDFVIIDNGAACLRGDEILFEAAIPEARARELVDDITRRSEGHHIGFKYYKDCKEYAEITGAQTKIRVYIDDDDFMGNLYQELSIDYPDLKFYTGHRAALALINYSPEGDFVCLLDAASGEAGKERALERLAAMFEGERAVAVGDSNNDIAMLKEFDGFVMSSAAPKICEQFDESHTVDSVADLIDDLMAGTR